MAKLDDLTTAELNELINQSQSFTIEAQGFDSIPIGGEGRAVSTAADAATNQIIQKSGRLVPLVRAPWIFSCRKWLRNGGEGATGSDKRLIAMWVNPNSIQVEMPKRASLQKTAGGSVMHQMRIRGRDDVFDEFAFSFEATTGNTMPVRSRDVPDVQVVAPGLVNKFDMNELQGLSHVIEETGEPNFIYAFISTPAYPRITLTGWFEPQAYGWSQSADDPNQITYSLKMEVISTTPSFSSASDLLNAFSDAQGIVGAVASDIPYRR